MGERITRRRFLEDAAAASAAAALAAAPADALAAKRKKPKVRRRRLKTPSVAVLGGGMAGLAAAHELIERGFDVTVFERKALGGKARSIPVPNTGRGGRRDLPGEHGFRFFPGFYHHVPDSMRRIPFAGNEQGVYDNLVAAAGASFARNGGREDLTLAADPAMTPDSLPRLLIAGFEQVARLPPDEIAFFVRQVMVFLTSSNERRFGQWENVDWWSYVRAADKSPEYQRMLAIGLTRNLVAAKAEIASTRTIGSMAEAFVYNFQYRGNDGEPDRVLDRPTNEAWIDPWVLHLRKLGVRFEVGRTVDSLRIHRGRIHSARVRAGSGRRARLEDVEADWFVCAMPVERARRLWNRGILATDPRLKRMDDLVVEWMNGIQFYLRKRVPIIYGHLSYVDSPWALTSISQAQFWDDRDFARDYGDGTVQECLSVDISNWDEKGILYGKSAKECTPAEVAREVWMQIKAHIEDTGKTYLPDDLLVSWFLDPALAKPKRGGPFRNDDPLLVNTVGSWSNRPEAATAVPNLLLAGDYVRTNIDLATMEGANESARHAVNALLKRAGSQADAVRTFTLYEPPEFAAAKAADAERYKRGEPNAFDGPWPST